MDTLTLARRTLAPLPYHTAVVDYLRLHEADVWRWANARMSRRTAARVAARAAPARYLPDRAARRTPTCTRNWRCAMARLGIAAPATCTSRPGQEMNAALLFVPGEVHIVVAGPAAGTHGAGRNCWPCSATSWRTTCSGRRTRACCWRPSASCTTPWRAARRPASQRETWRRYALHTELFADRGGAIAAGDLAPAVAALVKVQTGIGSGRCRRLPAPGRRSRGARTRPPATPTPIPKPSSARARWRCGGKARRICDAWIERRLQGPLALENLDLPGQLRLQAMTRGFLAHYLAGRRFRQRGRAGPRAHAVPRLAGRRSGAGAGTLRRRRRERLRARLPECPDARPGAARSGYAGRGAAARRAARPVARAVSTR